MKNKKKGFTLVELLVVIAIIAILAAIIAPNAFKAIEKSKVATAESDYKAIKTAALSYYADMGTWPNSSSKDGSDPGLINGDKLEQNWNGPYLEKWPTKNPWGGTYTFKNNKDSKDSVPVESGKDDKNYKYIELTNVSTSARDRLEADLDGGTAGANTGVVRYDSTTVYLIISEQ